MSITVRPYMPSDSDAFIALNLDWIEEYFVVEDEDRNQLLNHQEYLLNKGGEIVMAEQSGKLVGTGALMPVTHPKHPSQKWMEVVKMATAKGLRGGGVGKLVMAKLVSAARDHGAVGLWLETNSILLPAIGLYKKSGFRQLGKDDFWPTPYQRADVQMEMIL